MQEYDNDALRTRPNRVNGLFQVKHFALYQAKSLLLCSSAIILLLDPQAILLLL